MTDIEEKSHQLYGKAEASKFWLLLMIAIQNAVNVEIDANAEQVLRNRPAGADSKLGQVRF